MLLPRLLFPLQHAPLKETWVRPLVLLFGLPPIAHANKPSASGEAGGSINFPANFTGAPCPFSRTPSRSHSTHPDPKCLRFSRNGTARSPHHPHTPRPPHVSLYLFPSFLSPNRGGGRSLTAQVSLVRLCFRHAPLFVPCHTPPSAFRSCSGASRSQS
ncbi:hypothetical protein VUR80DRAFT_10187 [Thermomyces stellatus]